MPTEIARRNIPIAIDAPAIILPAAIGPAVRVDEITPFAKPTCPTCQGTGVAKLVTLRGRVQRICVCAFKRFKKAHDREVSVCDDGQAHWHGARP